MRSLVLAAQVEANRGRQVAALLPVEDRHGVDDPSDFVFVSAAPDGEVEAQHERHEQIGSLVGNAVAGGSLALRLTDQFSYAFA